MPQIHSFNHQTSLFIGTNSGTGYEPQIFDISVRYTCEGTFWEASGGVRYVAQIVDVTGKSGVFWRKFGFTAGLGILYHAGFYSRIGIEQDFYATAKLGFEFWKSGFSLHTGGAFGIKLTSVYAAMNVLPFMKDLNGYYEIYAQQKLGGVFMFAVGIRTFEYFTYNLGFTPNLIFFMECAVHKNWNVSVTGVVKYSDAANANSSPDGIGIRLGITYRFGRPL